jgi:hypothetical protein
VSRRRDGDPIPGTRYTITAAEQAAALGMKPGGAPKEAKPQKLTPAQARLAMSDKWVGEGPDIGLEVITIPGGRDVMDALGVDPATLPVGVEAEFGAPQPRPERPVEGGAEPPARQAAPAASQDAARKLIRDWRTHAAKVTADAEAARGTGRERENAAAESVRKTREVGQRIVKKLSGS